MVIDAFSRRCVGWSMRDDLQAEIVVDALQMAVTRRRPEAGLVHHSDRGSQYASLAFGATLRDSGIMASMGSRGDAYDNAAAESFFSTIKKELIYRHTYKTRNAARLAIFDCIERFYNPVRRHSTLGNKSPVNYELAAAAATSRGPTMLGRELAIKAWQLQLQGASPEERPVLVGFDHRDKRGEVGRHLIGIVRVPAQVLAHPVEPPLAA